MVFYIIVIQASCLMSNSLELLQKFLFSLRTPIYYLQSIFWALQNLLLFSLRLDDYFHFEISTKAMSGLAPMTSSSVIVTKQHLAEGIWEDFII